MGEFSRLPNTYTTELRISFSVQVDTAGHTHADQSRLHKSPGPVEDSEPDWRQGDGLCRIDFDNHPACMPVLYCWGLDCGWNRTLTHAQFGQSYARTWWHIASYLCT